jgi:hypothetical protein
MQKLSSIKVAEVLAQVPIALRAQQQEIVELKEKVAHYEKVDRATKIASDMQRKNLNNDSTFEEKVASLMESDDLDVVEKAVDLSAPQIKLASLSDHHGNSTDAADVFAAGLMD